MRGLTQDLIETELARAVRPCLTVSFQADGVALLHMIRRLAPGVPVLFLDTVHHFAETLDYAQRLAAEWQLNVRTIRASQPSPGLWQSSVDACCARHKVEPLFAALEDYDTWFTGLRRDRSPSRAGLRPVESFRLPSGTELRKVSPLADWTWDEVKAYVDAHGIPLLPLYARGYTSIGCAPCTSLPAAAGHARSGRWGGRKLECGIHVSAATDVVDDRRDPA